jgi:hypothetical protein
MKIMKIVTTTSEKEIIVDVLCNKCGESCIPESWRSENISERGTPVKWIPDVGLVEITQEESLELRGPVLYGLIEQEYTGGYDSIEGIQDLTKYTFSLCELCLKSLFDSFKIPVEKTDINLM